MNVKIDTLKRLYLLLATLYYLGFTRFLSGQLLGGKGDDAFSSNASGSIVTQILGVTLLLGSLLLILHSPQLNLKRLVQKNFWWILLIGFFFLSLLWSPVPAITFRRVVAFTTLVIVAYCLVEFFEPRSLLKLIAQAAAVAALIGLILAIISPEKAFIAEGIRAKAFTGMYFDKNGGARIYAYALLILIGLGLYKTKLQIAAILVLVICLLMTQSATAAVMLFFGLSMTLIFKFLQASQAQINLGRTLLLFIILAIGGLLVYILYEFILSILGRDPNLTNRIIIWELMNKFVEQKWLTGYGFGAFWSSDAVSSFMDRWGYIGNAHSGYYEALLHGGVICLSLVFVLILTPIINFTQQYIYKVNGVLPSILFPIVIVQATVNYVGYIIINHNCFDMFIFTLIYFISVAKNKVEDTTSYPNLPINRFEKVT